MQRRGRAATGIGLLVLGAIAFGARAAGWRSVFLGDRVVLPVGDAYYHARRAFWSVVHWPAVLRFDPLVGYPDGSWIPWPPLHDLLVAGLARCLGGSMHDLELVAAWLPPALGAAAVLPVFLAGARIGGRRLGLGAAALFALLPAQIFYSNVGDIDHHCTVALLGACWLAGALAAADPGASARARVAGPLTVALARTGLLLTWPGSLVYVAVADGSQLAVGAALGRGRGILVHAAGLAASAAVVALVMPRLGPPVGGPYSAIALSWLHVTVLTAAAAVALGWALWERTRPARGVPARLARALAIGGVVAAALLALPGLRGALADALRFVGQREPWSALNAEEMPLFRRGPGGWLSGLRFFGGFAYLIPLVPLATAAAARDPRRRGPALVLTGWTAGLGLLAILQVRYGNDYAAAGAVGFAVLVDGLRRALARPVGGVAAAVVTGVLVTLAALPLVAAPFADANAIRPTPPGTDPLLATPDGTLYRFAEMVRANTPETAGFDDPTSHPAYGILCPPNIGHVLHWVARRATTSDNFGPYAGSRHFSEARGFSWLTSETSAVALAERLHARYVVTMEYGAMPPHSLAARLHHDDGLARGPEPAWSHFRLVVEGPAGGLPLADLVGLPVRPGALPYKLFEVVKGAELEAHGAPGTSLVAWVPVVTSTGRRFVWRADAPVGPDGQAHLRVPYPSGGEDPVHTVGPWHVRVGDRVAEVEVSEAAVRDGTPIPVDEDEAGR
jgi:asparagine N-glycosylation enzyme membrane subunit Stt3